MRKNKYIAAGLFIISLTLYISTLAPTVVTIFDDSLEFQLVVYQLGIAHPTGYPLYTLLGKLFTYIPVGNVAYRANLMSAVFGAATVALTYLLILQMFLASKTSSTAIETAQNSVSSPDDTPIWPAHLGGVIGALLLAVGLVFWQQATIAEVYTLNAFFVAALLLLVTRLTTQGRGESREKGERGVYWVASLAGLSLTHHRTMLLLFPALVVYLYLIYKTRLFKPKTWLLSLAFGMFPLLLYLYLPWRGHIGSLDGMYQNTWAGFWRQVNASGYGLFIFDNPFGHERNIAFYWNLLADQFYTTVPGLIGIVYLLRIGQSKFLALIGIAFLTYLPFNLFYNVTDIEVFFIPIFLLWATWSGMGAAFLLRTAAKIIKAGQRPGRQAQDQEPTANQALESEPGIDTLNENEPARDHTQSSSSTVVAVDSLPMPSTHMRWRVAAATLILAIFAFMIFQLFQTNLPILTESYTWQVHDYGLDILQQPVPARDAVIVGILGEMTLLRYFQQTENLRSDIETVTADLESDRLTAVESLLAVGQTVYLTRELPGAPQRWSLNAVGPLIRVDPEPVITLPKNLIALNRPATPQIVLLGYTLTRPAHTGPGPAPVRLTLFWQAAESIDTNLKVSARLLTSNGERQAAADAVPVHFAYPTSAWRSGEIVSDVYDLALPVDTPPGQYTPLIIWYDPAQNAAEVGRVELEPVTVE
jgi:hypothetical protein